MRPDISIAIPTFGRNAVLVETVRHLLDLRERAMELIVVDQTARHDRETEAVLEDLQKRGEIRWIRLNEPSITRAMNRALLEAKSDIVLFLDDDILPEPGLVSAHAEAHHRTGAVLIAGRVIQPWEEGMATLASSSFSFSQTVPAWITEFMGGNVSIRRNIAIRIGGFDENFVKVAFRFEAEFAYRARQNGHRIYFEPQACIHHLKVGHGGTRTSGDHLTTWRPDHTVGKYYYAMTTKAPIVDFFCLPLQAIATRHHLRRPWWIPITLVSEVLGFLWARQLIKRARGYVTDMPVEVK